MSTTIAGAAAQPIDASAKIAMPIDEQLAAPEHIAERTADEDQRRQKQRVRLDHPLHLVARCAQFALDDRQRDVDRRRIDETHARAEDRCHQDPRLVHPTLSGTMPKKPAEQGRRRCEASKPTPPESIPRVIDAPTLDDHLEVMTRAIFQAGLSWALIDARWDAFRAAFETFDVRVVATYGEGEIDRLMEADGVVHSRSKIAGTIANARALQALAAEHGDIAGVCALVRRLRCALRRCEEAFRVSGRSQLLLLALSHRLTVPPFERWMERQRQRSSAHARDGHPGTQRGALIRSRARSELADAARR